MATLKTISLINSPSGRGQAALGYLLQYSPFLAWLEGQSGWEIDATDFDYFPQTISLLSIASRGIGEGYDAADLIPGDREVDSLKMTGNSVNIDITHKADAKRGLRDIPTWFNNELIDRFYNWAIAYENLLFNGSGEANEFKGLNNIFNGEDDLPGFDGITGVIDSALAIGDDEDSCDLTSRRNYSKFVEWFYLQLAEVENPTALIMAPRMFTRLWTIAKIETILGEARNFFGQPVPTFNNIPMVPTLATTLPITELDDADSPVAETTSIWIMSPGERRFSLVSNSGLQWNDYGTLEGKQSDQETWEIRAAWKVQRYRSARRCRNIKV